MLCNQPMLELNYVKRLLWFRLLCFYVFCSNTILIFHFINLFLCGPVRDRPSSWFEFCRNSVRVIIYYVVICKPLSRVFSLFFLKKFAYFICSNNYVIWIKLVPLVLFLKVLLCCIALVHLFFLRTIIFLGRIISEQGC